MAGVESIIDHSALLPHHTGEIRGAELAFETGTRRFAENLKLATIVNSNGNPLAQGVGVLVDGFLYFPYHGATRKEDTMDVQIITDPRYFTTRHVKTLHGDEINNDSRLRRLGISSI